MSPEGTTHPRSSGICRPFRTHIAHEFLFPVVKTTGYKNVTPPGFVMFERL